MSEIFIFSSVVGDDLNNLINGMEIISINPGENVITQGKFFKMFNSIVKSLHLFFNILILSYRSTRRLLLYC